MTDLIVKSPVAFVNFIYKALWYIMRVLKLKLNKGAKWLEEKILK